MNRLKALTVLYSPALEPYLNQEGIEFTKGKCPQLGNRKVIWIENYDKTFYTFMLDNNLIPLANFKAYYFDEEIVQVNERNYPDHLWNVNNFETNILQEWLPIDETL